MNTLANALDDVLAANTAVDNPFDHTAPNISVFGSVFSNKVYAFLGGLWAIASVACAVYLVIGIAKFAAAKKAQHNPDALSAAAVSVLIPLIGIALLGGVGAIFGAAVGLFS